MSRNYADYQSGQPGYTDLHQPYQFHAAQQPDYQQPPTHHQYAAARSWQQERASFYQLDRYPPQLDPDPPDSLDWWQPYHPYNQSTPAARQPNAYQPHTQTLITPFGEQNSLGMDPFVHQQNPDAGYHHGQPEYQPPRTPSHFSDFYGQHQTHHAGYHPWQPSYHLAGQPLQFDQSLSHRTAPLPAAVPPQSGSTHLPLQARKLTDSGQQRGLLNIPSLKVQSFSPAQLSAVNDYNEKLRVYRLDQAALLARVTAWSEENTNDENIADLHHGPSSSSRPAAPAVPPPPPQRSSSCWSSTSPTSHCSLAAPLPAAAAAPSFNLPPRVPPCSPDICGDERLTAIVRNLESRMDDNKRFLGDPHAATQPPPVPTFSVPYTAPISCPLQHPPTQRSPPCDQLLNQDPIGDDKVLLEVEEFRQVANEKQFGLDRLYVRAKDIIHSSVEGPFTLSNVEASKELIVKEVESGIERYRSHNRVDITMLSNKIDSCLLKEDEDGSIEEVKKVIACVYGVWHVGNVLGINHRSTFLDADARLIPPCIGFIDCSATPLPTPLELDEPTLTAQRWARLLWKILFRFRLSAKHGSCAFDPGGSTSQNFAREWKTIEAYVLRVLPQVTIIGVHPFDTNAKALLLHLNRRVALDQAGGFFDGVVIEIDKEIFRLCNKELTEGMGLVSHSAICTSLNDMFEEIWTIFKLFLAKAESFCTHYSLKDANVVVVPTGADMNFSRLGLIIAPEDAVQLYLRLASPMMETRQHQEHHEVFHDNLISELHSLLVSWFPP